MGVDRRVLPFIAALVFLNYDFCFADEINEYSFTDARLGRVTWMVEDGWLPWVGSFNFLSSSISFSTVLLSVLDSNGGMLGSCSTQSLDSSQWRRFVWTLNAENLQCNVSDYATRVRFPLSTNNRSLLLVRISSVNGPQCISELVVQNERPSTCPPKLTRNAFASQGFNCGCGGAHSTDAEPITATTTRSIVQFPIFQLTNDGGTSTANVDIRLTTKTSTPATSTTHHPCSVVYCANGGTCVIGANMLAFCRCVVGYSGPTCDQGPCSGAPCVNGGICRERGATFTCTCPSEFTGDLCETPIIECEPKCSNQAACILDGEKSRCNCSVGFIGANCNIIDVCLGSSLCSRYGDQAVCRVDDENMNMAPASLINASYRCFCEDSAQDVIDCEQLSQSSMMSTAAPTQSTPSSHPSHRARPESSFDTLPADPFEMLTDIATTPITATIGTISRIPNQQTRTAVPLSSSSTRQTTPHSFMQHSSPIVPTTTTSTTTTTTQLPSPSPSSSSANLPSSTISLSTAETRTIATSTISPAWIHPISIGHTDDEEDTTVPDDNEHIEEEPILPPTTEATVDENEQMIGIGITDDRTNIDHDRSSAPNSNNTGGGNAITIVLIVLSVIIVLMLGGLSTVLIIRYVRRSRKLHGKYNPAKEEGALNSNLGMPMTSVNKEERLI